MWDRLLVDCNIATFEERPGNPLGLVENAAIGITDGKVVRVGKRTELAGFRAKQVDALGGAWVTPGLIDCHTHLVFGGTRADEHALRGAGASYEEIAKAGGGIASTVKHTASASDEELLEQSRRRLHALMSGGCTTVEIKSGYGLDPKSELRLLKIAHELGESDAVRVVPTLLALHAIPGDQKDRRAHYVGEIVDKLIPAAAKQGIATSIDAFCETIAFTPDEVERLFKAAAHHGLSVRLHAEQLSNQHGAALAAQYRALSADHLEHLDEAGAKAMAAASVVGVLLPTATLSTRGGWGNARVLRDAGVTLALGTDCNPGTSWCESVPYALQLAAPLLGLTVPEAIKAATAGGAAALRRPDLGVLTLTHPGDLLVLDADHEADLLAHLGAPAVRTTIVGGVPVSGARTIH
jgi:imidazolonepropionase